MPLVGQRVERHIDRPPIPHDPAVYPLRPRHPPISHQFIEFARGDPYVLRRSGAANTAWREAGRQCVVPGHRQAPGGSSVAGAAGMGP